MGRGCALAAAIGLALIGGCGLAAHLYDRHWEKKVEAKLAEYRAAGQPVTWEEVVAARQSIPAKENSALILLEAFKQMAPAESDTKGELFDAYAGTWTGGATHSEQLRSLVKAYLDANQAALGKIGEAAVFPRGAYPLDPAEDPVCADMDYLRALRDAVKLCRTEAVYHAEMGDDAQGVASLVQGRRAVASIGDAHKVIEGLVRCGAGALWLEGVQRTLELCEISADGLHAVRSEMSQEDAGLSLEPAFHGERSMGHYYLSGAGGTDADWLSHENFGWRLSALIPGCRQKDALFYYRVLDRAAEISRLPLRQRCAAAARLEAEVQRQTEEHGAMYAFSAMFLPTIAGSVKEEVKAHAALRVSRAALAVEQWRLAHGRWPDSLDELVPELLDEVPDDPFCEEKIRYRRTEDGVVIYSVGPDGQDDEATTHAEANDPLDYAGSTESGWDIPFGLLDPELRGARTLTFRDEVMDSELPLEALEEAGYTKEKLRALGFSEADIRELGWR